VADVLRPEQRRFNMSRVRSKDTKPELLIRRGLHERGFRFRLHRRDLPGSPDLVFPALNAVIFVNGCFWHGHGCSKSNLPVTRRNFWEAKITSNRVRDARCLRELSEAGWRTLVVWECSLVGPTRLPFNELIDRIAAWLHKDHIAKTGTGAGCIGGISTGESVREG
jgi:DNA mismatch endonuclease, patch repair protein